MVKIDQAFINAFIDADFGLEIAHENLSYKPTSGTEYEELLNIPNNVTPLSLNDTDETTGLFRIILYWPADVGAIQAKIKADEILSTFKVGTRICYESQCSTITRISRTKGVAETGWYKTVITIGYYAAITR